MGGASSGWHAFAALLRRGLCVEVSRAAKAWHTCIPLHPIAKLSKQDRTILLTSPRSPERGPPTGAKSILRACLADGRVGQAELAGDAAAGPGQLLAQGLGRGAPAGRDVVPGL